MTDQDKLQYIIETVYNAYNESEIINFISLMDVLMEEWVSGNAILSASAEIRKERMSTHARAIRFLTTLEDFTAAMELYPVKIDSK